MKILVAIMLLAMVLPSCGKAKASGDHAEIIPSQDGSTCYGIYDGDGNLKGGNCK